MTNTFNKILNTIIFLLTIAGHAIAQAPASSESPYSDQKFPTPDDPVWYETPTIWIALVLLLIVLIVLRIRRKQEKYT